MHGSIPPITARGEISMPFYRLRLPRLSDDLYVFDVARDRARCVLVAVRDNDVQALAVFSRQETALMLPIFENTAIGHHCPYEVLYARFAYEDSSDEAVARAGLYLRDALENGTIDDDMHALRKVLWSCRIKLKSFGLLVVNIHKTGYVLMVL
jgi:hypothetical protein